ncbi:hypothetical protein LTR85_009514 [Meristemomyces frigidus]|nr:hypothetical protein LTR85_009514 [Meristemomyces frigidus]
MAATYKALHIYEIVELIVTDLDRPDIHRCERVSHIFRTVALSSSAVAQNLLAITPIRASDIKALTFQERALFSPFNSRPFRLGISFSNRLNFHHQLVDAAEFEDVPHYARPTKFEFNPHLDPRITRHDRGGLCDVRGTTVELRLPKKDDLGGLVFLDHYATSPAIAVVKVKLRTHGKDFSECWLRVPSGVRVRDLVLMQKAMLKTIDKYGGACCGGLHAQQCIAVFVHDTLTSRLRDAGDLP